jgi:hypothetical protein
MILMADKLQRKKRKIFSGAYCNNEILYEHFAHELRGNRNKNDNVNNPVDRSKSVYAHL